MRHLKSLAGSTLLAAACTLPAAALDVPFEGNDQSMVGGDIHAIELSGMHYDDMPVMEGDTVAYNSDFMGEPVYLEDNDTQLGTVEMVFLTDEDRRRVAILINEETDLAVADMIYVLLPQDARADGSITLELTGEELIGMSQNSAD